MRLKNHIFLFIVLILIIDLAGCEAFVRKFTRKNKREKEEVLVLAPEEYKDTRTQEERYREFFTFWKSWQDELIDSLLQKKSNKKLKTCADQAIKNLLDMRKMLNPEKQKRLDIYIDRMNLLRDSIASDIYGNNSATYMEKADQIKMSILKEFSYKDIANFLI